MPSPFPGMDRYIEECGLWEDFHGTLIHEIRIALARSLPDHYLVHTGERAYLVLVESEGKTGHPLLPDVSVTTPRSRTRAPKKEGIAVAETPASVEPLILRAFIEKEHRERFVEINEADAG